MKRWRTSIDTQRPNFILIKLQQYCVIVFPKQRKCSIIDNEDISKLDHYRMRLIRSTNRICIHKKGAGKSRKYIPLTHILLDVPCGMVVDHIDHNILNNRKSNLRICTQSENSINRYKMKNCTSQYKGVSLQRGRRKKWRTQINIDGKQTLIGNYYTEIEAAKAYNRVAIKLFGDFALTNQLDMLKNKEA